MDEALPVAKLHFPSHVLGAGHGHEFPAPEAGIADQGTAAGGGFGKGQPEAFRMAEGKKREAFLQLLGDISLGRP